MAEVKHLLDTAQLSKREVDEILELTGFLKEAAEKGVYLPLLKDMSIAMMFDQQSTRTRVSFETAATQLGGHALYLSTQTMHVSTDIETVKEAAIVVSSMVDGIVIRTEKQSTIEEMARWSSVPVLNAMSSDGLHPTQAISDLFTILERLPNGKKLSDVVVMIIGDTSDDHEVMDCVFRSLFRLFSVYGMTVIACSPEGYTPSAAYTQWINEQMGISGGKLIITHEPHEYIADVDFIYTGTCVYHDIGHSKETAMKVFFPKYQVNAELMQHTPAHCKVMHYLPGYRNMEITDEVWDGPQSILMPEAENRLHTQRGLLAWYLYPHKRRPAQELFNHYMGGAIDILTRIS